MTPYGSYGSNYGKSYTTAWTSISAGAINKLTPAINLRGVSIVDVKNQGDIVVVTTASGEKYFLDRYDFEYMYQSGQLHPPHQPQAMQPQGIFGQAGAVHVQVQSQSKPTTAPKLPEKNSLKRVYYHNRLRKKT